MRYEILERRRRRLRGSFTPQLSDESLGRNDLARVHQEERQQRSLLLAAQRNRAVISDDLERTQDPELDHGFL
jgi:tRNA uridine 5-carbamoylmethylation protein Kti12